MASTGEFKEETTLQCVSWDFWEYSLWTDETNSELSARFESCYTKLTAFPKKIITAAVRQDDSL